MGTRQQISSCYVEGSSSMAAWQNCSSSADPGCEFKRCSYLPKLVVDRLEVWHLQKLLRLVPAEVSYWQCRWSSRSCSDKKLMPL